MLSKPREREETTGVGAPVAMGGITGGKGENHSGKGGSQGHCIISVLEGRKWLPGCRHFNAWRDSFAPGRVFFVQSEVPASGFFAP